MKFSIPKSDILDVLAKVQGLTGRKTNMAITQTVLIQTQDNGISICATDLETGFEGIYTADVLEHGAICLNSRKLFEIIRDFPSDHIRIAQIGNQRVEIGERNILYHLMGMNPDDFPIIPKMTDVAYFELDSSLFRKMIDRTANIQAGSENKQEHVLGVFMDRKETEKGVLFRMASTDGGRLAVALHQFGEDKTVPLEKGVLIPKKGLSEVGKFLDAPGMVELGFKSNMFIVKKAFETLIVRLIEGEFPVYDDVIETQGASPVIFDREMFLMMLKRMSILSSEDYRAVIFNFQENRLKIESTNPKIGDSKEDIGIHYSGKEIQVGFNPRFFIDALNLIDNDKVILHLFGEEKPCIIEGEEDDSYLCAIMPMKL
jgi:DNA polymerase III subunit beta